MSKSCYILVNNHTEGMGLYELLRADNKIQVRIAPAPREATSGCGMSLLIAESNLERARTILKDKGASYDRIVLLENQIDPGRDVYC